MDGQLRHWLAAQFVTRLLGALVVAVWFYFLFDLTVLEAVLTGLAFVAITASAQALWWWGKAHGRS